jgi:hypothetical protein
LALQVGKAAARLQVERGHDLDVTDEGVAGKRVAHLAGQALPLGLGEPELGRSRVWNECHADAERHLDLGNALRRW